MNIIQWYLSLHVMLGLFIGEVYLISGAMRGTKFRLTRFIAYVIGSLPFAI